MTLDLKIVPFGSCVADMGNYTFISREHTTQFDYVWEASSASWIRVYPEFCKSCVKIKELLDKEYAK